MITNRELTIYGEPESWSKYRIVCLHPLADQGDLLSKLEMRPEDCVLCDVYWDYRGDLLFISFSIADSSGINLHFKSDLKHPISFVVKTSKGPLTKDMVEKGIDFLKEWIAKNDLDIYKEVDSVVPIFAKDLFLTTR